MRLGRALAAGLAGGLGLLLIGMATPRLVGALLLMPGDAPLARVLDRRPASADQLAAIAQSRRRALGWADEGRLWTEIALAELMQAEQQPVMDARRDLLPVREHLVEGLARAPSNAYAWARLAYVEDLRQGPTRAVMNLVRMSILTGPHEDRLLLRRLDLALRGWPAFPAEDADLVYRQIRRAWERARPDLLQLVRISGRADVVRAALADDPQALAALAAAMAGK